MKKLEKILAIGTIVIGGSLLAYGFAKEKPWVISAGLLCFSYPAGLASRALIEKSDREYYKKFTDISRRQNMPQKGL